MEFQEELDNFAKKAQEFCKWAESDFTDSLEEIKKAERYLANLHSTILDLPELFEIWNEVDELEKKSEDKETKVAQWKKIRDRFENLPINGYWEIFDASEVDDEIPVFAQISDDLADIYGDLKDGLKFYQQEKFAEAFWEWKFLFQIHWGNHLVGAQKAIRNYLSFKTEI